MKYDLIFIFKSAGIFAYPLAFLAFLGTFIFFERVLSLNLKKLLPKAQTDAIFDGKLTLPTSVFTNTISQDLLSFFKQTKISPESLKAYAQFRLSSLDRGLFILEIIISTAPLIGLLGTVTGLVDLFFNISDAKLPDTQGYIEGISLALTTTILGLLVAIPAIAAHSYLLRKIELIHSEVHILVERLINLIKIKE